jgi:polyhydroxyalkanoate synthesis regulator phasin
MPQQPDWNKYLDAGVEFVAMTRAQARQRAKVLVGTGQLAQEQVTGFVDELVDESRRRTDLMLELVRKEIQRQVKTLGIATKEDLARLESRLAKKNGGKASKHAKASTPKAPKSASAKKRVKKSTTATSARASASATPAPKQSKKTGSTKKAAKRSAAKAQPAKKRSGRAASKAAAS